jgi:hypothetical protein
MALALIHHEHLVLGIHALYAVGAIGSIVYGVIKLWQQRKK